MGEHADLLREGTNRLHAMGAGWWDEGNDQCCLGKSSERSRPDHLSARVSVAAPSILSDASYSRHVIARAFGAKHGGDEGKVERGRMEGDRRARGTSVTAWRRPIDSLTHRLLA